MVGSVAFSISLLIGTLVTGSAAAQNASEVETEVFIDYNGDGVNPSTATANPLAKCLLEAGATCAAAGRQLYDGQLESAIERDDDLEVMVVIPAEDGTIITTRTEDLPANALTEGIPSIDIVLEFDFDSARIRPPESFKLERIAEAMLTQAVRHERFLLLGHTDAKGGNAYNCGLSAERARAVRADLVARGVGELQLAAIGAGETMLKPGIAPDDGQNRRVGFIRLREDTTPLVTRLRALCD